MAADIFVLRANGKFLVRPSTLILRLAERSAEKRTNIALSNLTEQHVTFFFPGGFVEPTVVSVGPHGTGAVSLPGDFLKKLTAEPREKGKGSAAPPVKPVGHAFTFAVHIEHSQDFAVGDSAPIIIVDP
jgi:hypothetical protein